MNVKVNTSDREVVVVMPNTKVVVVDPEKYLAVQSPDGLVRFIVPLIASSMPESPLPSREDMDWQIVFPDNTMAFTPQSNLRSFKLHDLMRYGMEWLPKNSNIIEFESAADRLLWGAAQMKEQSEDLQKMAVAEAQSIALKDGFITIEDYIATKNISMTTGASVQFGVQATKYSKEHNFQVVKVPHVKYRKGVNAYSISVLDAVFPIIAAKYSK
jgi:hypothetical protein